MPGFYQHASQMSITVPDTFSDPVAGGGSLNPAEFHQCGSREVGEQSPLDHRLAGDPLQRSAGGLSVGSMGSTSCPALLLGTEPLRTRFGP